MSILFKKRTIFSIVLLIFFLIGISIVISGGYITKVFSSNNQIKDKEEEVFFRELDSDMAQALEVNLSDYSKYDTQNSHKDIDLLDVVIQVPKKYGDYYAIYISEKNNKCKVLKQDLDGVFTLYEFEKEKESTSDWKLSKEKSIQGEYKFINDYFIENPTPGGIEEGKANAN